jgi:hypothetical protein
VPWLLVDLLLVLVALALLVLCGLQLWWGVKRLGREVSAAGEKVAAASDALAQVQAQDPVPGAGPRLNGG